MKKVGLTLFALMASSQVMAFGEPGHWSSGWGQGVSEYTAIDAKGSALYIACSEGTPVRMTLTVNRVSYGSGTKQPFHLIIDGKEIQTPYETGSRVGSNNFYYAWDAIRKAKTLQAKTGSGQLIPLPLKDASKALPSTKSKAFTCQTDF